MPRMLGHRLLRGSLSHKTWTFRKFCQNDAHGRTVALLTLTLTSDAATDIRHIAKLPNRSLAAAVGVRCAANAAAAAAV